jgi:hypothetical protein
VANVEGLHHLHCLVSISYRHWWVGRGAGRKMLTSGQNLLRQALYFNVDYYRKQGQGAFVNDEFILHTHISTCVLTKALRPALTFGSSLS